MALAPNLKITYAEQLQVLRYILGTIPAVVYDANSARKFIFQTQYQLRVTNDEEDFPEVDQILQIHDTKTLDISVKEASGRAQMGIILVALTNRIQDITNIPLYVDYEYMVLDTHKPGPGYACDVAVAVNKGIVSTMLSLVCCCL